MQIKWDSLGKKNAGYKRYVKVDILSNPTNIFVTQF